MATFVWTAQGTDAAVTNITVGATDKISFYGAAFGNAIATGSYQDSTHAENSGGTELCTTHINNNKYLTSSTISINGGGSQTLNGTNLTTVKCSLKVNFSHGTSVATSGAIFWAYDGTTDTVAPTSITVQIAEQADTAWVSAAPRSAALALNDQTTNTSHDFFMALSASPVVVGVLTAFAFKIELTYQ